MEGLICYYRKFCIIRGIMTHKYLKVPRSHFTDNSEQGCHGDDFFPPNNKLMTAPIIPLTSTFYSLSVVHSVKALLMQTEHFLQLQLHTENISRVKHELTLTLKKASQRKYNMFS